MEFFVFKACVLLQELKKYFPFVYSKCYKVFNQCSGKAIEPDLCSMKDIPSISIDYPVVEKSSIIKVIPANIGWTDLGSFDSLYKEMYNPILENALLNKDSSILLESKNNLIMSHRKVVIVDVEDL